MTELQRKALARVVMYILDNEQTSYDEWLANGKKPENHICFYAQFLEDTMPELS